MTPFDLTAVLRNAPAGEWIALSFTLDRIVATAPTLHAALQAASKLGEMHPVVMKVPPLHAMVL
jgi:hypothetical protein